MNLTSHLPSLYPLFLQVVFSLATGNIAGAFEIITSNDSIGEVFVAKPLDREELDHYILKVSTHWLCPGLLTATWEEAHLTEHPGGQVSSHVICLGLSTVRLMGRGLSGTGFCSQQKHLRCLCPKES